MKLKQLPSGDAFSLVEVTLALGIAACCLVVLVALVPTGINNNQASIQQSAAAAMAQAIAADLRNTAPPPVTNPQPANVASPYYQIPIPVVTTAAAANSGTSITHTFFLMDDGSEAGTGMDADASTTTPPHYRATVTIIVPNGGTAATAADILISWPALADRNVAAAPKNFAGSFELQTEINRN